MIRMSKGSRSKLAFRNCAPAVCAMSSAVLPCVLGMAFLLSASAHLSNPYIFLGAIYGLDIVSPSMGYWVAILLPCIQLVLAILLFGGVFVKATHRIAFMLLLSFLIIQIVAWKRGLDVPCGCFGMFHETSVGLGSISLTGALLLTCAISMMSTKQPGLGENIHVGT